MKQFATIGCAALLATSVISAQPPAAPSKPASPEGTAATQVGGQYVQGQRGQTYQGGKWIEITYGRPIKRGRDVYGSGANYAKDILVNGAKVWRAGANVSTRIKSEAPLSIAGKTMPAGEYSLFIDTKSPTDWTLIVSSWPAQTRYDANNKDALWGSFGYTPDKDVLRAPMQISTLPYSVDQLTWSFVDMTANGGKLAIMWDKVMASVAFTVAGS
jgi:DUF2911 family protein